MSSIFEKFNQITFNGLVLFGLSILLGGCSLFNGHSQETPEEHDAHKTERVRPEKNYRNK